MQSICIRYVRIYTCRYNTFCFVATTVQDKKKCLRIPKVEWSNHQLACRHCSLVLVGESDYKEHMAKKHPDLKCLQIFPCSKCPLVAVGHWQYNSHKLDHEQPSSVKCQFCSCVIKDSKLLIKHLKTCRQASDKPDEVKDFLATIQMPEVIKVSKDSSGE